jgi:hypothetical protein
MIEELPQILRRKDKCSWLGGKGCEKMNLSKSNKSAIFNPNSKINLWL